MVAVPMGVWVGSARRWLASGMGVCPRRQERAATIPYPPRDRKPAVLLVAAADAAVV